MRIITNKGQYNLPDNFVLEMERTNPFFSQVAEKSIPITLPATPNNLRITGYYSLESKNKPVISIDVLIEDGVTRLAAKQVIHKINKEGISTTFYLKVGAFWTKIKDKKLKDVMSQYSYNSSTLILDLQNSMKVTSNYDFVVFPVACNNGNDDYFILNETENVDAGGTTYLIGRKSRTISEGGKDTVVPINYGITPFLRLGSVLSKVISHFGYSIENNFLLEGEFFNLFLLNNCADTVTINRIDYGQIVPDISIQDLLDVIRTKFGCEFIPDEDTQVIKISFFKDQLSAIPQHDLSAEKVSGFEFDLPSFSQLVLTQDTSLDNAAAETETLEEFVEKYKSTAIVNEEEWADNNIVNRYDAVLRLAEGRFYAIETDGVTVRREPVSSIYFNYNKKADLPAHEIEFKDSAVPLIEVNGEIIPFVGSILHQNTAIKEKSDSDKKEALKNCMLCFAKFSNKGLLQYTYGSTVNYNNNGIRDGLFSLQTWGEDGIFHRFYRQVDSFYRHANITVNTELLLSEGQKNSVSEIQPVMIENQVLLPDTIAYTIGRRVQKKCLFRSVKLLDPFDVDLEQSIPLLITNHTIPIYFWVYNDDSDTVVPTSTGDNVYKYRLSGEIIKPTVAPTEQQYDDSQEGIKFYESTAAIIVEHYLSGVLLDEIDRDLTYYYSVGVK